MAAGLRVIKGDAEAARSFDLPGPYVGRPRAARNWWARLGSAVVGGLPTAVGTGHGEIEHTSLG
jgi:hypothetical protein